MAFPSVCNPTIDLVIPETTLVVPRRGQLLGVLILLLALQLVIESNMKLLL
jgi:hypothetical protein